MLGLLVHTLAWFGSFHWKLTQAATSDQWRERTIYQVLTDRFALPKGVSATCADLSTYCGGTYSALIGQLDYIQGMGFDALWISPIIENRDTPQAYHGYWPQDPTSLNTHFGSSQDLQNLVNAVHGRGMFLMVDWVINHMSVATGPSTANYKSISSPWNSADAFHSPCDIDYTSQTSIENCWFSTSPYGSLPDVYTEKPEIFNPLVESVANLVAQYKIDGIRLDTAKYVPQSYLQQFQQAVGVFVMGEVADGRYDYVGRYQNYLDSTLNYALWYNIVQSLALSQTLDNLGYGMYEVALNSKDPTILGTFLDNHDQARFASNSGQDIVKDSNAVTFLMFHSGIPIVYYGFEQQFHGSQDPNNREMMWTSNYDTSAVLYQYIAKLHGIRAMAAQLSGSSYYTQSVSAIMTLPNATAFERGKLVVVVNNLGARATAKSVDVPKSQYSSGDRLVDLLSCDDVVVGASGSFTSPAASGNAARIWIINSDSGDYCPSHGSASAMHSAAGSTSFSFMSTVSQSPSANDGVLPSTPSGSLASSSLTYVASSSASASESSLYSSSARTLSPRSPTSPYSSSTGSSDSAASGSSPPSIPLPSPTNSLSSFTTLPSPSSQSSASCPPPRYTCWSCKPGTTQCSVIAPSARADLRKD